MRLLGLFNSLVCLNILLIKRRKQKIQKNLTPFQIVVMKFLQIRIYILRASYDYNSAMVIP